MLPCRGDQNSTKEGHPSSQINIQLGMGWTGAVMKVPGLILRVFRAVGVSTICCVLVGGAVAQTSKPIRSLPMADARVGPGDVAQGDLWMEWSPDHKLGFVQGLLDGSYWGYFQACNEAGLVARSVPDVVDNCMKHIPTAQLKSEQYVSLMTEFYQKYPEDRALPMRRLLMKLLEPRMGPDGVHNWLNELIESVRRSQSR